MYTWIVFVMLTLGSFLPFEVDAQDLVERSVLSGKAQILIPSDFHLMDQQTLALKYPSPGHRPTEVYTNTNSSINIALNHTLNRADPEDLTKVKKAMEAQFMRAPFKFIKSEIKNLNGTSFILLEFVSPAVDTSIYNYMGIASLERRLVMVTFNCTENHRHSWEVTGQKIINSIVLGK